MIWSQHGISKSSSVIFTIWKHRVPTVGILFESIGQKNHIFYILLYIPQNPKKLTKLENKKFPIAYCTKFKDWLITYINNLWIPQLGIFMRKFMYSEFQRGSPSLLGTVALLWCAVEQPPLHMNQCIYSTSHSHPVK